MRCINCTACCSSPVPGWQLPESQRRAGLGAAAQMSVVSLLHAYLAATSKHRSVKAHLHQHVLRLLQRPLLLLLCHVTHIHVHGSVDLHGLVWSR